MTTDNDKAVRFGIAAASAGMFMSKVRPDMWPTGVHACNFIIDAVEDIASDKTTFVSTGGFTVREEMDEVVVSLDIAHFYNDGDGLSLLNEDYRNLFNI